MSVLGRMFDGGKLRYDLIPVLALEDMVKGLTFGTIKYDDNNWVKVPNGRKRYLSAALRHIQEYRKGNLWDEEQNIHHLSAAMNNLSFIVEKDLRGWEDSSEEGISRVDFSSEELLTFKNPFGGKDISQEELKAYVSDTLMMGNPTGGASHSFELDTSHFPWYPHVKEGENPWIEWREGRMPDLDPELNVSLLLSCERDLKNTDIANEREPVGSISWENSEDKYDIVAYKIVD